MGKLVAAYARVSTERQAERQTIAPQLAALARLRRGAGVGAGARSRSIATTAGAGRGSTGRGSTGCATRWRGRRSTLVLIASPDRLARRYAYQVWLLEEFARAGCAVVFLERPPSDDPQDALVMQIRGAVAEYERTVIADRTRRGRLAALQAGRLLPWSSPPYGYRADPQALRDPARLAVDAEQAAVVRQIFAWYVRGGAHPARHRPPADRRRDPHGDRAGALGPLHRRRDPAQHELPRRRLRQPGAAGAVPAALPAQRARAAAGRRGGLPGAPGGRLDRRAGAGARHRGPVRGGAGAPRPQPGLVAAQHARGVPPAPPRQLPALRGRRPASATTAATPTTAARR